MNNYDKSYKKLFTHPEMIRDLLKGFVDAPFVHELDFSTAEKYNAEFTTHKRLKRRASDIVWKVKHKTEDQWLYIYILLEFQSKPDPSMALRMMSYMSLLYLELYDTKQFTKDSKTGYPQLPPILPLVLYNGKPRWHKALDVNDLIIQSPLGLEPYRPHLRYCLIDEGAYDEDKLGELTALKNLVAALFRLEKSQSEANTYAVLHSVAQWLAAPEQLALQLSFTTWIDEVLFPSCYPDATPPNINYEQEGNKMLAETVKGWYNAATAEGKIKGKIEGKIEGEANSLILLLKTKFSNPSQKQKDIIFNLQEEQLKQAIAYIFQASSLNDMFTYIKSLQKSKD